MIKSEDKDKDKVAIHIKELEEMIEKYSTECVNCDNELITVGKCERMYEELQKKLLPKSKSPFITPKKK